VSKQEEFWRSVYAQEYINRNSSFNIDLGVKAWSIMLKRADYISSILELGPNIGRNIASLNLLLPSSKKSIVEISPLAFEIATSRYTLETAQNCAILDATVDKQYDLVITSGVLIHVPPEDLQRTVRKAAEFSKRYLLVCEMFSRVPRTVRYRDSDDLLFTRDYGKFVLETCELKVIDYGFLWGYYFDEAGFDDANWWLFEKR